MIQISTDYYKKLPDTIRVKLRTSFFGEMARSGGLKPDIPKNIVKGIFSSPERLQLDIKFKDYQKLVEKRKEARVDALRQAFREARGESKPKVSKNKQKRSRKKSR